jgi:peptidyl-prolyl cis-trans isomerase D
MAVIGNIRKRTGLVIGFIALALMMFLLMDALSSSSLVSQGGGDKHAGKINGENITVQEYATRYNNYEGNLRALYPGQTFDDETSASIRDQVWNDLVFDHLVMGNLNKMGINVSALEIAFNMWGPNPHPIVRQMFTNPNTGQFDPEQVRYVIQNMEELDQNGMLTPQMTALQNIIEEERLKSKYASMVTKGVYIPTFLLNKQYMDNSSSAIATYIPFLYAEINDEEIKITEADIKNYLKKNAHKYQTEAYTELEYILLDIIPTAEDTAALLKRMTTIYEDFVATENDSLFSKRNTEIPNTFDYYTKDEITDRLMVESFFSLPIGTIIEPYEEDGAMKVSKIMDRKLIADSLSASHILFRYQTPQSRDSVITLADSLIELLKSNRLRFADAARIHSQDQSNANIGGYLGYFKQGQMVKPFNDKVFYGMKQGEISRVESDFGLHIIRVDQARPTKPAVRLAECVYTIRSGKTTNSDMFRKAVAMEQTYNTGEKFEKAKDSLKVKVTPAIFSNQASIPGIGSAREIVRWSFQSKVDEVKMFDLDNRFIIARIKSKTPKGVKPLDEIETEIELEIRTEKKAEQLIASIKSQMSGVSDIQQLAAKSGREVATAMGVSQASPFVEGAGSEPALVGAIYGAEKGKLSGPVKGRYGVYVFELNEIERPSKDVEPNYDLPRLQIRSALMSKLSFSSLLEALKDKAKIEDKRYEFY